MQRLFCACSRPLSLLLLLTALFTLSIQSGELGTSDTTHRLQVTHSLWTGQPQVPAADYPEFGVHGRGGRLYASYGIGQSLLMLPADLAGTAASKLPLWRAYVQSQADPAVRSIVVSCSTNVLLNVLTALAAFRFLIAFGFSVRESVAGVLALLCATTHLQYAQNMTENNSIFLLTLVGILLQYRWLLTGERRWLLWGSAALGLNLLTRITTVLDILAAGTFLLLAVLFSASHKPRLWMLFADYLKTALPVYAVFAMLDRVYQFVRFGRQSGFWTSTYVSVLAKEQRSMDPALPASFPFNGHAFVGGIHAGVWGPLFAPQKSIFLFDPLFALMLLLAVLLWRHLAGVHRAYLLASGALVVAYIAFYARYLWWAGDFSWGDRYISSAVEMATLLAVPLLLRYRRVLGRAAWLSGTAVVAVSVAIQCASLAFWLPLEIYQTQGLRRPVFIVLLRFKNIAAFALHRRAAWGLKTPAMFQDPWDAAHITAWNFLPSLLRHIGAAPLWAVDLVDAVWIVLGIAVLATAWRLMVVLRDFSTTASAPQPR
jgi:hypothetical protein